MCCGHGIASLITDHQPHFLRAQIHFEDFRMFTESFGMQLDDDSLLALYHVYDPTGR